MDKGEDKAAPSEYRIKRECSKRIQLGLCNGLVRKCLPCRHKDLSLIPRTHRKAWHCATLL